MALTDYAQYKSKSDQGQKLPFVSGNPGLGTSVLASAWKVAPLSGVVPSIAAATNNTTAGALLREYLVGSYSAARWLSRLEVTANNTAAASLTLVDRLSHQGGLDGTATSAQTANLPTAALTRYTSGVGVFAALEIYTAVGSTATTAHVSYTNQSGTSGHTSKPVVFGATGANAARTFIIIPLQDGDTGVRSVESVTLSASTGTAGNFGVTLFRPLLTFPVFGFSSERPLTFDPVLGGAMMMPEIQDGACLNFIGRLQANPSLFIQGEALFI